jgi:hypothetical protein
MIGVGRVDSIDDTTGIGEVSRVDGLRKESRKDRPKAEM